MKSHFGPFSKNHKKIKKTNTEKPLREIQDVDPYIPWDKFEKITRISFGEKEL